MHGIIAHLLLVGQDGGYSSLPFSFLTFSTLPNKRKWQSFFHISSTLFHHPTFPPNKHTGSVIPECKISKP